MYIEGEDRADTAHPYPSHAVPGPCPHWAWCVVVRSGGTIGKVCPLGRGRRLCDVLLSRMSQPVAAVTFAQSRGRRSVDGMPWIDAAVSGASPHLVGRPFWRIPPSRSCPRCRNEGGTAASHSSRTGSLNDVVDT
ncbi:hypothetical protein HPB50_002246 [Hyalomma asiaticum]|uniref:Uncharacterized protein n=1 Tax=Hyalomma asiaticum TaxID=266040 RepID=A0ACB7TDR6_HYAAI|nr:hypothetical protein HPB50_002246 [Hyalomma asiaticum]